MKFEIIKSRMESLTHNSAASTAINLLDLPDEVLLKILVQVVSYDATSLTCGNGVDWACTRLGKLCKDPSIWRNVKCAGLYVTSSTDVDYLRSIITHLEALMECGRVRTLRAELVGMQGNGFLELAFQVLFDRLLRKCRHLRSLHLTGMAPWGDWQHPPQLPKSIRRLSFDLPAIDLRHVTASMGCVSEVEVRKSAAMAGKGVNHWPLVSDLVSRLVRLTTGRLKTLEMRGFELEKASQDFGPGGGRRKWLPAEDDQLYKGTVDDDEEEDKEEDAMSVTLITESGKRWTQRRKNLITLRWKRPIIE